VNVADFVSPGQTGYDARFPNQNQYGTFALNSPQWNLLTLFPKDKALLAELR